MWLWWAQTVVKGIFEAQQTNRNIFLYALRKRQINIEINHPNTFTYNTHQKFSFPLFALKNFIQEHNIEILHCHLAKSQIMWWMLKTLFFPDIKLIFHEHWEIFEDWKLYPFLMDCFRNKVDTYIAVSRVIKVKILEKTNFGENKIHILYNFVDLNRFKIIKNFDLENERKKYWLNQNDFIIWFAGRLVERKWWKEFVESAKILSKKYNMKFLIAGVGPDKEKLLEMTKGSSNIQYIWYVDNMVDFYNWLDVFCIPSYWEWLPMAQLEALWCWVSIISSDWPWLNEVIKEKKNYFQNKKIDDLINKIETIYSDKDLRHDLVKNWLQEVKKYSLENYLVELYEIYQNN
jgi:L-malate glycosyltransferase